MRPAIHAAEHIAARLGGIRGIVAVALGGSWARGEAHPDSDLDLGLYYRSDSPPSVGDLRRLARELDDRHLPNLVTEIGAWGPWINGGGWLRVEDRPVDWLYRDADKVTTSIERCVAGETSCFYQPGHPHGFHEHIYPGEVSYCRPLHDPEGLLKDLKAMTSPYPPKLKRAIVDKHLWEAGFSLETARKSAARGEVSYVSGCLYRGTACMVQALFALNERYFVNEKGSVRVVESFARRPEGFEAAVDLILGSLGRSAGTVVESVLRYEALLDETNELCAGATGHR